MAPSTALLPGARRQSDGPALPSVQCRNPALPSESLVSFDDIVSSRRIRHNAVRGPNGGQHYVDSIPIPMPQILGSVGIRVTPASVDILRRSSDGFIAAYSLFSAAFPLAPNWSWAIEREYLGRIYTLDDFDPASWLPVEQALSLGEEYGMSRYVRALIHPSTLFSFTEDSRAPSPSVPRQGVMYSRDDEILDSDDNQLSSTALTSSAEGARSEALASIPFPAVPSALARDAALTLTPNHTPASPSASQTQAVRKSSRAKKPAPVFLGMTSTLDNIPAPTVNNPGSRQPLAELDANAHIASSPSTRSPSHKRSQLNPENRRNPRAKKRLRRSSRTSGARCREEIQDERNNDDDNNDDDDDEHKPSSTRYQSTPTTTQAATRNQESIPRSSDEKAGNNVLQTAESVSNASDDSSGGANDAEGYDSEYILGSEADELEQDDVVSDEDDETESIPDDLEDLEDDDDEDDFIRQIMKNEEAVDAALCAEPANDDDGDDDDLDGPSCPDTTSTSAQHLMTLSPDGLSITQQTHRSRIIMKNVMPTLEKAYPEDRDPFNIPVPKVNHIAAFSFNYEILIRETRESVLAWRLEDVLKAQKTELPFHVSLWIAMSQWHSDVLARKLLDAKPPAIKHLLGKPGLTAADLQKSNCTLPLHTDRYGTYINVMGPSPEVPDGEAEPYCGSSVAKNGGIGKRTMTYHRRFHTGYCPPEFHPESHEAQLASGREPHILASTIIQKDRSCAISLTKLAELFDTIYIDCMPLEPIGNDFDHEASRQWTRGVRRRAEKKAGRKFPSIPGRNRANQALQGGFGIANREYTEQCTCGAKIGKGGRSRRAIVPGDPTQGHQCLFCRHKARWQIMMEPFSLPGYTQTLQWAAPFAKKIEHQAHYVLVEGKTDACVDCGRDRVECGHRWRGSGANGRCETCSHKVLKTYRGIKYTDRWGIKNAKRQWEFVQRGGEDKCMNSECGRARCPREAFFSYGENGRCRRCRKFRERHGGKEFTLGALPTEASLCTDDPNKQCCNPACTAYQLSMEHNPRAVRIKCKDGQRRCHRCAFSFDRTGQEWAPTNKTRAPVGEGEVFRICQNTTCTNWRRDAQGLGPAESKRKTTIKERARCDKCAAHVRLNNGAE